MSSQDTLFLPDDSFFSLYRVFGVTEVFNEVLGDYICLCSRGSLFGLFALHEPSITLLYKCFTVYANVAMFHLFFFPRRSFFVLTRFLASQVFNKALSIFVHSFSSGTPLSSSPLRHEDRGGVLVLVVT